MLGSRLLNTVLSKHFRLRELRSNASNSVSRISVGTCSRIWLHSSRWYRIWKYRAEKRNLTINNMCVQWFSKRCRMSRSSLMVRRTRFLTMQQSTCSIARKLSVTSIIFLILTKCSLIALLRTIPVGRRTWLRSARIGTNSMSSTSRPRIQRWVRSTLRPWSLCLYW
jgi:hypothetical protein